MNATQYREKAHELLSLANSESNASVQVAYAAMAQGYLRLADMAELNSKTDIVYETPKRKEPSPDTV
jgi:hypothetical protein